MFTHTWKHGVVTQITALKPVTWNKIMRLLLAWGILLFVLVTTTRSNSRGLFFLFLTHNVHFLLWVPAVSGINFQNKENGLCSWRGESLGLTCIRLSWRREEISWILFGYFSVAVGGLCGRNLTLFCLPVVCLNRGVAAPRKAQS